MENKWKIQQVLIKISKKIVSCYSSNIEIYKLLYSGYPVTLITALEFNNKITPLLASKVALFYDRVYW